MSKKRWRFRGTHAAIGFEGVQPFVRGYYETTDIKSIYGRNNFFPDDLDHVEVFWEIHPSDYKDLGGFEELSQSVKEEPDNIHYTIETHGWNQICIEETEPVIEFYIVVPKLLFETQYLVWKDFVFGNTQTKYTITLEVDMFLETPSTSTIEEFRKENPRYINVPTLEEWKGHTSHKPKPLIGKDEFGVWFEDQKSPDYAE
jgi:hypothetical protein